MCVVCVCFCASVCTRYVCVTCVLSQNQHCTGKEEAAPSSTTAGAVFQTLAFVPVVTVYVCVVGAQQEIEQTQQQFHVQRSYKTHMVGPSPYITTMEHFLAGVFFTPWKCRSTKPTSSRPFCTPSSTASPHTKADRVD